jgi:hypothetical protein
MRKPQAVQALLLSLIVLATLACSMVEVSSEGGLSPADARPGARTPAAVLRPATPSPTPTRQATPAGSEKMAEGIGRSRAEIQAAFERLEEGLDMEFEVVSAAQGEPAVLGRSREGVATLRVIGPEDNPTTAVLTAVAQPGDTMWNITVGVYLVSLTRAALPEWEEGDRFLQDALPQVMAGGAVKTSFGGVDVHFVGLPPVGRLMSLAITVDPAFVAKDDGLLHASLEFEDAWGMVPVMPGAMGTQQESSGPYPTYMFAVPQDVDTVHDWYIAAMAARGWVLAGSGDVSAAEGLAPGSLTLLFWKEDHLTMVFVSPVEGADVTAVILSYNTIE